jgi:hypothetical protein
MTMIAYAFLQHRCLAATARKKESTCPARANFARPYVTPCSSSSLEHHRSDVRIVENGSAASSGVSNSAKIGLARVLIDALIEARAGESHEESCSLGDVTPMFYPAGTELESGE